MDYDINELIIQAQAGDKEAMEVIYEKNKKLIYYVVNMGSFVYHNKEDLFQVGCIGLINAINTFDTNKNFKFSTYAVPCIQNEIGLYLRRENKNISNISINHTIVLNDEGGKPLLEDTLMVETNTSDIEANLDFANAFKKMKPRYKTVINLLFIKDMTQGEVAKLLNVTHQEVRRIKIAALKFLKLHMQVK